jgi:hypothetical protein
MNFAELKKKIEIATKQAFLEMFEKHGKEGICAFSLDSDEGAWTVGPATDTTKHLEERLAEDEYDDLWLKYGTPEWEYEGDGADELFGEICELCRNEVQEMCKGKIVYHLKGEDKENFEKFQRQLFETCIEVLEKLKSENFFKQIVGKDILLLFSVSEYDFSKKEYAEIVARLNDNEIRNECLDWIKTWSD